MFGKFLVVAAFIGSLAACAHTDRTAARPEAAAEVAAAAEKLRVAMLDADATALSALVAEDLNYGHSGGKIDSKAVFIKDLVDKRPDFLTITVADQDIKVLDSGLAIVRHKLTADYDDSGKRGKVALRVLGVWQKQGGAWRLLVRQAVSA
jgi:ketosteroid isomerase-like protein